MDEKKPTQGNKGKQPKAQAHAAPVATKMVMKGERKMLHHLFASDVVDCLKNVSYTPRQPKLEPMPHKHFFHTVDNRGRRLTTCSMANGHYHEVTWRTDEHGNLVAESGPAIHKVTQSYEDGSHEVVDAPVEWQGIKGKVYKDNHRHEWEYIDSEEFTSKSVAAIRESNREELAATGVTPDARPMQTPRPITHEDGVTIREGSTPTKAELSAKQ